MLKITIKLGILCIPLTTVYCGPTITPDSFKDNGQTRFEFTCTARMLPGDVLVWYQSTDKLADKSAVDLYPIPKSSKLSSKLQFRTRVQEDLYVWLSSKSTLDSTSYKIVYGGWSNAGSAIMKWLDHKLYNWDTPIILIDDFFYGFWIRWDKDTISTGHEGQDIPFMSWKDTQPIHVAYYAFTGYEYVDSYSTTKIRDPEYDEDIVLGMTQLLEPPDETGQAKEVKLILKKTLQNSDKNTRVYCAKHTVLPGGTFNNISRHLESTRIPIIFKRNVTLAPPFVEVEPNNSTVYYTVNSKLTFTCSGSDPVDGRKYTWFKTDPLASRDLHVTVPQNQQYDPKKYTNILQLEPDETYHGNTLHCTQGYHALIRFNELNIVKPYGEISKSKIITLMMKTKDESRTTGTQCEPMPWWVSLSVLVAVVLAVATTTIVAIMRMTRDMRTQQRRN